MCGCVCVGARVCLSIGVYLKKVSQVCRTNLELSSDALETQSSLFDRISFFRSINGHKNCLKAICCTTIFRDYIKLNFGLISTSISLLMKLKHERS